MNIWFICYILFVHYIADFVCQTSEMASRKSKDSAWLTFHVAIYTLILTWGMALRPYFWQHNNIHVARLLFGFLLINSVAHWIVDYITSRINSNLWSKAQIAPRYYHWFFVSVGFDQLIHTITLILTAYWLLT